MDIGATVVVICSIQQGSPPLPPECDEGQGLTIRGEWWYSHVAECDGAITVSTCNDAEFDTRMAAYTGSCAAFELIACSDNTDGCSLRTTIMTFPVQRGQTYRIRIGSAGPSEGIATITLSYDLCAPAADLTGDGIVDGLDLGILLANWSIPPGAPGCKGDPDGCPADLDEDGHVGGLDLGILLANWTIL